MKQTFEKEGEIEERVMKIFQEIVKKPLKEILSYALKGEEDAIRLYSFLYEKIEEPHSRKRFKQFMKGEKAHKEKILHIFGELFPNEEPEKMEIETLPKIIIDDKFKLKTVGDYLDVLEVAMEAERLAERMYKFVGESFTKKEYKELFFALSNDEKRHYDFVKSQYDFYRRAKVEEDLHKLIDKLLQDREGNIG